MAADQNTYVPKIGLAAWPNRYIVNEFMPKLDNLDLETKTKLYYIVLILNPEWTKPFLADFTCLKLMFESIIDID